jgi:hypothetical protein
MHHTDWEIFGRLANETIELHIDGEAGLLSMSDGQAMFQGLTTYIIRHSVTIWSIAVSCG